MGALPFVAPDTLFTATVNVIVGNAGSNLIDGKGGSGRLDGGAGADTLIGGSGHDTYVIDSAGDEIGETEIGDIDTVVAGISFSLAVLGSIERLEAGAAAAAISLVGNGLANALTGNAAANLLDGGTSRRSDGPHGNSSESAGHPPALFPWATARAHADGLRRRRACLEAFSTMKLGKRGAGDGARTRDLRRDRPAL